MLKMSFTLNLFQGEDAMLTIERTTLLCVAVESESLVDILSRIDKTAPLYVGVTSGLLTGIIAGIGLACEWIVLA